jgi:S-DNA-T family DNA segregation ATPase FtsK/SpoIIIE
VTGRAGLPAELMLLVVRNPDGARRMMAVRIDQRRPLRELGERLATDMGLDAAEVRLHLPGRAQQPGDASAIADLGFRLGDEVWFVAAERPAADPPVAGVLAAAQGRAPVEFQFPQAPAEPPKLRLPLPLVLWPLPVAALAWLVNRQPSALLLGLGAPALAAAPLVANRVLGGWRRRRQARGFRARLAEARQRLAVVLACESHVLRGRVPDPSELEARALSALPCPSERAPDRPDFLRLRLGWGDTTAAVRVHVPDGGRPALRAESIALAAAAARVATVPLTVDLRAAGPLGLAGPAGTVDGLVRWLLVQAAALHRPDDLALAAFLPRDARDAWRWLRWLPHAGPATADPGLPSIADTADDQRRLARELEELVVARRAGGAGGPAVLVAIHEDAPVERAVFAGLLRAPADSRVSCLWIGSDARLLPDACAAVAELTGEAGELRLRRGGEDHAGRAEFVDVRYAQRIALALAGRWGTGAPTLPGSAAAQ